MDQHSVDRPSEVERPGMELPPVERPKDRQGLRVIGISLILGLGLAWLTTLGGSDEARAAARVPADWRYPLAAPAVMNPAGMVVTDAPIASEVGIQVLRLGGNAVDAAVATAFALAVVLPSAGNLGGGGFALSHVNGETRALDFRETAPAAARRDLFLDPGRAADASVTGHLAVAVPGTVAGLWELHQRHGTLPWSGLVAYSVGLAREGFEVDPDFAGFVGQEAARLARFQASASLFLPAGRAGTRFTSEELAATLERIALQGPAGFYQGPTADLLVAEMGRGGGLVTHADLEAYRPVWREPVVFEYRGHRVASMPPPSSGGITLAMIGHQLAGHDLAKLGFLAPEAIHLEAEAMRRAFAVRNEALGDPDQVQVDTARLASADFGRTLGASIDPARATPSSEVSGSSGIVRDDGPHATHFSVADRHGNAVALTTTLSSSYGSAVTVAGAGFLLNNAMDAFAVRPGTPNADSLAAGELNAIAPGKRMLSSMSPTIAFGPDGRPVLVTGASGGPFSVTTVFQLLSARLDYDLGVAAAMSAPRLHHQHLPDQLALEEGGFPQATRARLEALGHRLSSFQVPDKGWTIAGTLELRNNRWVGFADPRIHGRATGP